MERYYYFLWEKRNYLPDCLSLLWIYWSVNNQHHFHFRFLIFRWLKTRYDLDVWWNLNRNIVIFVFPSVFSNLTWTHEMCWKPTCSWIYLPKCPARHLWQSNFCPSTHSFGLSPTLTWDTDINIKWYSWCPHMPRMVFQLIGSLLSI